MKDMVDRVSFGVVCNCVEKDVDDQLKMLFLLDEEYLLPVIKSLVGTKFLFGG